MVVLAALTLACSNSIDIVARIATVLEVCSYLKLELIEYG